MLTSPWPHGTPLYVAEAIRALEARHASLPLMERAGEAVARLARNIAAPDGKPVLILAGPGNNGGDAFVAARYLKQWFFRITVLFAGDPAKLPTDAKAAHAAWLASGGTTVNTWPDHNAWDLVIDGLFGIGLKRPLEGRYAQWINALRGIRAPVLAIDIPSGLDADTGAVHGACVHATHTITFLGLKPGLLTLDGPDHSGIVHLEPLGITHDLTLTAGITLGQGMVGEAIPVRLQNSHKGTHGSVAILGGSEGMVGAALLAARAALNLGAGRVYVGLLAADAPAVDPHQPELMLRSLDGVLAIEHLSCIAIGPGLGTSAASLQSLQRALAARVPLVIDADALNLIASNSELKIQLEQSLTKHLLTPHPAEAARLLGVSTREVQDNRIEAALQLTRQFNAHVVLKGAGSICTSPDGKWAVNTSGNPGMASAGMGDVLTGIIAALLAQGATAAAALLAAVWLHGAAADQCVAEGNGPVGLTAGETILAARRLMNTELAPSSTL